MTRNKSSSLVAVFVSALVGAAPVRAGTLEGEVALPPTGVEEPPLVHGGFAGRIKNPVTDLRAYDPRPQCFVWLDEGPVADAAREPPKKAVVLELDHSAFDQPVLPVVVGSEVDIKNSSKLTHALYSPNAPDALPADAVGPGGVRSLKVDKPFEPISLASRTAPHLEGRVVGLPTSYFSRLERDGTFKMTGVPAGKWTVKVWCGDGWVGVEDTVELGNKTTRIKLVLPERLEAKKAAGKDDKAKP